MADMIPMKGRPIDSLLQRLGRWYTHIPYENMYHSEEYSQKLSRTGFSDVLIQNISEFCFPGFSYYGTGKQVTVKPVRKLPKEVVDTASDGWYLYSGVEQYILVKARK
eukprot:TRINITY_DN6932_c0_g1_i2.p1 TRINITY_DN6932_c0_g1~~TRINITY_DN6932_c0_g1_i2.p1  ORF type:complete len:108 (+),score=14.44 TRINITY_DN6932_c0_g1_i2:755-1078(+)